MKYFDRNNLYKVSDMVEAIMKVVPNYYKDDKSCERHVDRVIKKRGMSAVNRQKSRRVFSGMDANDVVEEIVTYIRKRKGLNKRGEKKEGKKVDVSAGGRQIEISDIMRRDWILMKDQEPNEGQKIVASLAYMNWSGDWSLYTKMVESYSKKSNAFIVAWMPVPEPYDPRKEV